MFFKRSGLRRTGTDIEVLKQEVKELQNRVSRLECPHNTRDLVIEDYRLCLSLSAGRKFCESCGKTIETYRDFQSVAKARNKLMRELIALNEKEMKGEAL